MPSERCPRCGSEQKFILMRGSKTSHCTFANHHAWHGPATSLMVERHDSSPDSRDETIPCEACGSRHHSKGLCNRQTATEFREGGLPRDPFSGLPRMPAEIEDALRESCTCDGYNHRCAYISTKLRAAIRAALDEAFIRGSVEGRGGVIDD